MSGSAGELDDRNDGQWRQRAEDLEKICQAEKEKRKKIEAAFVRMRRLLEMRAESDSRYRTLFDGAEDAIFIHDPGGRLLDMNQAARKRLGAPGGESQNPSALTMAEVEGMEDASEFIQRMARLAKVDFLEMESVNMRGDGTPVPVEMSCRRIQYGGGSAVMVIARDITERLRGQAERKRMSEQLRQVRKLESIGMMAAGIAHGLSNILFPILGYAEMALDEAPDDGPMKALLIRLVGSAHRGREMVRQILAIARKSDGRRSVVDVAPVIDDLLNLLKTIIPRDVRVRKAVEMDAGSVLAEPSHIHQILMSLCINGLQAMEESGGVLSVDVCAAAFSATDDDVPPAGPGRYVRIRVSDTGAGMPPEALERIFEPRFTGQDHGGDAGMGLATIHEIIRSYGGVIRVESTTGIGVESTSGIGVETAPGIGSSFTVLLPAAEASAEEPACEPLSSTFAGCSEHLLVVDDDARVVAMLTHMLRRMGYRVTPKTDSRQALAALEAAPDAYDLLLTDQEMPGLSGTELAAKAHFLRPDLPILICSEREERITPEEALALGIRDHLIKPPDRVDLSLRIRQALERNRKRILVIDDDPEILKMLKVVLERAGYEVIQAGNARDGRRLHDARKADLIITDIVMPDKNGNDFIYEIKKDFPGARIIAITGGGFYGTEMPLETALKLGAFKTFAKPLPKDELLAAIREELTPHG